MSAPVHYDLEAVERQLRRDWRAALAAQRAAIGDNPVGQARLDLQDALFEARLRIELALLSAANDGMAVDDRADCLAMALAQCEWAFLSSCGQRGQFAAVDIYFCRRQNVVDVLSGAAAAPSSATISTVTISAVPGSRA